MSDYQLPNAAFVKYVKKTSWLLEPVHGLFLHIFVTAFIERSTNKGQFDLVLLPFNSISHLYEIEQQLDTFKNTYDHLAPNGRFVVDIYLPDIDYLSDALNRPSYVYLEDEITAPDDEFTMLLYTTRKYDQFEQVQHITWTHEKYFENGENERYLTKLDMHVFFPRELQLLFLATGFSIEAIYGGYDWKPFGKGTRQIVVGRKREGSHSRYR